MLLSIDLESKLIHRESKQVDIQDKDYLEMKESVDVVLWERSYQMLCVTCFPFILLKWQVTHFIHIKNSNYVYTL